MYMASMRVSHLDISYLVQNLELGQVLLLEYQVVLAMEILRVRHWGISHLFQNLELR